METGILVALVVAFISGGGGMKLIELIRDAISGAAQRRRREVDAIAKQTREENAHRLAAEERARLAEERERAAWDAERATATRLRKCSEILSATRSVALDHRVPLDKLPPVEY